MFDLTVFIQIIGMTIIGLVVGYLFGQWRCSLQQCDYNELKESLKEVEANREIIKQDYQEISRHVEHIHDETGRFIEQNMDLFMEKT